MYMFCSKYFVHSWSSIWRPRYAWSCSQTLHGLLGESVPLQMLDCNTSPVHQIVLKLLLHLNLKQKNVLSLFQMKNADYFSNYVTEDFTTYINRKRKNNCHGNHIEMQAMAEMYNRPVEVYQYGTGVDGRGRLCLNWTLVFGLKDLNTPYFWMESVPQYKLIPFIWAKSVLDDH